MSIELGHTPIQEELPFNPLARKDWSELPHAEAQRHLTDLARRGDDIHDITMPEAPTPDVSGLTGLELARKMRSFMNEGGDVGELDVSHLGPEEPDELPVAKTRRSVAQPDLSGREVAGHIDAALRTAETSLGRSLTEQESAHIAVETERVARNGQ